MIYDIPSVNYPKLEKQIERLNKKCKINLSPLSLKVIDTFKKERRSRTGFDYNETIYQVELIGDSVTLAGWTLVSVIQPVKDGENIIREVPGEKCPNRYRTIENICDHCGQTRKRKAVYLLRSESGDHKVVGRSCIGDFLGKTNPESLLKAAEWLTRFVKAVADNVHDPEDLDKQNSVRIEEFLSITAMLIRSKGWLPKSKAFNGEMPTSDIAWALCAYKDEYVSDYMRDNQTEVLDCDIELAKKSLQWGKEIDEKDAPNNYIHNLGVSCRQPCVVKSRAGYVASVINAYKRDSSVQPVNAGSYVGVIGKRDIFKNLKVVFIKQYNTDYGPRALIKFRDPEGNTIVWRASGGKPDWIEKEKSVTIKGTVTKHEEYGTICETTMNRLVEVS